MKRPFLILLLLLGSLLAGGCAPEPEVLVVEITRLVEVEKEVTRIVEVPVEVTAVPPTPANPANPELSAFSALNFLRVELWPDYDQPAVLVLLTGEVPANVALPVTLAIPVPAGAQINAVAQIDENGMTSIDYEEAAGAVIFASETTGFRVEYYAPYERDGDERSYDFEWSAPFAVGELDAHIQKPVNATELITEPEAAEVYTDARDGLTYYRFDPLTAEPEARYGVRLRYRMASDQLTADTPGNAPLTPPDGPLHDQQAQDGAPVEGA